MTMLTRHDFRAALRCPAKPARDRHRAVVDDGFLARQMASLRRRFEHDFGGDWQFDETPLAEPIRTFALHHPGTRRIVNAPFSDGRIRDRVDALHRQGDGWVLIGFCGALEPAPEHLLDVAIQYRLATANGLNILRTEIACIDPTWRRGMAPQALWRHVDVSDAMAGLLHNIDVMIPDLLTGREGVPSTHCRVPSSCPHMADCESALGTAQPIHWLPNSSRTLPRLRDQGLSDIRDIPDGVLRGTLQDFVRRVVREGRPYLDPAARHAIDSLGWPRAYLDFESVAFAVPRWDGVAPYEHIPFQWSLHIHGSGDVLRHRDFLATGTGDPRAALSRNLLDALPPNGPILVYNAAYEKRIIKALAQALPRYRRDLLALLPRIVDLLPIVKQHFYDPRQRGSWSLKAVLPCLVPSLGYGNLNIQDGNDAQLAFWRLLEARGRHAEIIRDLRAYCRTDTLAMIAIAEALRVGREPAPLKQTG